MPKCDFGLEPHSIEFEFSGDHRGYDIHIPGDVAHLSWDDVSRVLTVNFDDASERVAEQLFWRLLEIVPALRSDRR